MMDDFDSLSDSRWEYKYHVVFIPKCRRKVLYAQLRGHLGEVFRRLAQQKESRVEEGQLMADHVHMLLSIPPKYAVSQVVGYMKGKSAIHLARVYGERKQNFVGQHFWARGYFVVHGFTAVQQMLQLGSERGICQIVDQKDASEQTPVVKTTFTERWVDRKRSPTCRARGYTCRSMRCAGADRLAPARPCSARPSGAIRSPDS
jgi:putative transposase